MNAQHQLVLNRILSRPVVGTYLIKAAFAEGAWNAAKFVGDQGSYFIPGVGSARMGYDAIKDFGQGKYWRGIGNTLGAGVSLIPGVGGGLAHMAESGIGALRGGAKLLGATAESMPTLARWGRSLPTAMHAGENALQHGMSSTLGKLPGAGRISSSAPIQWMKANPKKTMLGAGTMIPGVGVKPALEHMQSATDAGKEMAQGAGIGAGMQEGGSIGQNMAPSAQSLLRMTGFGGGEMDPRYMGGNGNY